jgi:cell division septal protein FtsQ
VRAGWVPPRILPNRRSLAVGAALIVAAVLAYVIARETPVFSMRQVEVRGADAIVSGQVQSALEPLHGTSLVTLDGSEVVRRVEALSTVVSARYDRAFPHGLVVSVVPEQPVGVLRQGEEAWLISARARVMARLQPGAQHRLPRVWVDRGITVEHAGLLTGEAAHVTPSLRLLLRSRLAGRVTTARWEEGQLTFVLRSGVELRLGRPIDVALKLAVAARVLGAIGAPRSPGYIDLVVPTRPVASLNSQPAE